MTRFAALPLVAATALTSWLAFLSWRGFVVASGSFVVPLLLGIVVVSAVGVGARSCRLPAPVVACTQVLSVLLVANAWWGTSALPSPASLTRVVERFDHSVDVLGRYAAPVPANEADALVVLLLAALLLHVLVDLLAVTVNRVAVAGLPLLAIYTVPVSVLEGRVNWLVFALAAGGFLLMLALQEGRRLGGWGRHFGAPPGSDRLAAFGAQDARRHPVAIGAVALGAAVLVPLAIPVLDVDLLPGTGSGDGGNDVKITNPMTDLHRDLARDADVPLLQVTADARPRYFRVAALTRYTGATWTPGDRDLPTEQSATGSVPRPPGLPRDRAGDESVMQIRVTDAFKSLWLPTPLVVSSVEADDDWRYDASVLDFHSADNSVTTAEMSYDVTRFVPDYDAAGLSRARPAPFSISSEYATVPDDLPDMVVDLAEQVTDGVDNPYDQAVALQDWFRNPDNFTYSLEPEDGAITGNGNDALVRFLAPEGRVGYCEQFSAAMAIMARALEIPARVSVGFLAADAVGGSTYEFSSHDLHAWPELYFEGYGWVMFEPTPQDRASSVPDYAQGRPGQEPNTPSPTSQPTTDEPSTAPSAQPTAQPETSTVETAPAGQDDRRSWWPWAMGVLLLAALAGLVLLPRLLRNRRSRIRWEEAATPSEAAWEELRDTAVDLGRTWPEGRSLREAGREMVSWFGDPDAAPVARPATGAEAGPTAVRALERLVAALEEDRYAPAGTGVDARAAREWCATCVAALRAGVSPRTARRAAWWPTSALQRRKRVDSPSSHSEGEPERVNTLG